MTSTRARINNACITLHLKRIYVQFGKNFIYIAYTFAHFETCAVIISQ